MKKYIDIDGYHIKKKKLTEKDILMIKNELKVRPKTFNFLNDTSLSYKLYRKIKNEYILPRFWAIQKFGKLKEKNHLHNPEEGKFKFLKELRNYQIDLVNKTVDHIIKKGGGLLSVRPGGGKTVMALNIAAKLKKKTLVIVHKTFLQDQWIERIKFFTDAKIGIIKQNKCEVDGNDIVIGSIHSISKRDYGDIYDKFGFVIYDEAHHVSSKYFSKTLLKTNCKYTLALTATPYRLDGLINVMYWFLGDCIHKDPVKINKNVTVKKFYFSCNDEKLFVEKRQWARFSDHGKTLPNVVKMINNLVEIKDRNSIQVNIINEIRKIPKRNILILSGRKNHLFTLKEKLDLLIKEDLEKNLIEEDEVISCYFHGELSKKELEYSTEFGTVIFGTYEMAKEALDIPRLNTIFFTSPIKDITQAVGRILRKILQQGDVKPLVIDFIDDLSVFKNHGNIRTKQYKKTKYNIEDYYIFNNKICSHEMYQRFNGFEINDDARDENIQLSEILHLDKISENDLIDEDEFENLTPEEEKQKKEKKIIRIV